MKDTDTTHEWSLYQTGIDYNTKLDLNNTVDKNERFYAGDQWNGVQSNGMPTPVFNIIKRIINYFIAAILSQNVKMQYVPENVGDEPENEDEQFIKDASELISQYSETLWEKKKMGQKLRQWLLDAFLSGDAVAYNFWNQDIKISDLIQGDIDLEGIDNVNLFFGNPNDKEVERQPYIVISFRQLVSKLKEEAKKNKIPQDKIDLITSDEDTSHQSGDRSKIELDEKEHTGKTIALLKLWKKNGIVYAKKVTKYTEIRPEWNTKLTKYPVALMNCDLRKNSYRGQAIVTGLIPNQIFINKMFALAMSSLMNTAFPKVIYNKSLIPSWNNQVGVGIGVDGAEDITKVARYLEAGQMSNQIPLFIDNTIQYTKDMLGATDAALGDVKPDNTSAIIAVQQAAAIPLETIKQNLYQFVEDIGYIWLDFMANYYGVRSVDIEVMGKRQIKEFDFSKLKNMQLRLKIDVGPSSYWSEITALQTLDNLLEKDRITFMQYLDRLPSGIIPQKQELIEELKLQDTKQQFIYEQMAKFMESLPPQIQQQIMSMQPEEQEGFLMDLMMKPQEEQQLQLQQMLLPQAPIM